MQMYILFIRGANMDAQELIKSLKQQLRGHLSTKDYQTACSILGNIRSVYEKDFLPTYSFEVAKQSVSKMQSSYSKLVKIVSEKELSKLKKFISSCQREVNAFGHKSHKHLLDLLEETGANIFGVPAFMYSGDSDDYDDYCVNRRIAEALYSTGI